MDPPDYIRVSAHKKQIMHILITANRYMQDDDIRKSKKKGIGDASRADETLESRQTLLACDHTLGKSNDAIRPDDTRKTNQQLVCRL